MQQVSESPTMTSDAAPTDVITSPEAAARKCPECESLMGLEQEDESGHLEPGDPFELLLRCSNPDCGHVMPVESESAESPDQAAEPPAARSMACQTCGLQVLIAPLPSGHGFKLLAIERDVAGVDHQSTFGVSANGLPICPKDGVALIPLGPVPIAEAFAGIPDALQDTEGPVQPRLPGTTPPFDVEKAYRAEHRLRQEVRAAEREYEDKAATAKEAKKELERVQELLGKLMDEHERREREARYEDQHGTLRPEQNSVCAYERQTGQPCHVCREARKKAKESGSNEAHDHLVSVEQHLERRGFFIGEFVGNTEPLLAIQRDTPDLFAALERWAHDESVTLAKAAGLGELVNRACIAGPHGEAGQHCTRCGAVLVSKQDEGETLQSYPEGASVGLDCASALDEEGAKPEPARQPQRRHKTSAAAAAAKSHATREEKRGAKPKAEKKPARQKRDRA